MKNYVFISLDKLQYQSITFYDSPTECPKQLDYNPLFADSRFVFHFAYPCPPAVVNTTEFRWYPKTRVDEIQ